MAAPETRPLALLEQADEPGLVAALEAAAEADMLSGNELARQIGIDQALWSRVRRGVQGERFGPRALSLIVRRYPHLRDAAVRYLAERQLLDTDAVALLEEASRTSRDGPPTDY